ncbi:MAG: hypothetical protein IBX45_13315 [Campylobacterales bacterium]|nr:hypothetical protein [Campylobacterales bacterium]
MLELSMLIGEGKSRKVYQHPIDPQKVIKVEYLKAKHFKPNNEVEYLYYAYLKKKNKDLSCVAKCYGWVETKEGRGLVFEKICNEDGTLAKTLREAIAHNELTFEEADGLICELIEYLKKNTIMFVDVSLDNIVLRKNASHNTLVIIDGLGSRRMRLKFKMYLLFPSFAQYKIKKQTQKLYRKFKQLTCKAKK